MVSVIASLSRSVSPLKARPIDLPELSEIETDIDDMLKWCKDFNKRCDDANKKK